MKPGPLQSHRKEFHFKTMEVFEPIELVRLMEAPVKP